MSHLIPNLGETKKTFGCPLWEVDGAPFRNTAVQFWSQLTEEVECAFPTHPRILFQMLTGLRLNRSMLSPELELEKMLEHLKKSQLQEEWAEVLDELELEGSPNPVLIQVIDQEILSEFSLESVDAEAFSFLLAWLLEWSRLPQELWSDEMLQGSFQARDPQRNITYEISHRLQQEEIHEGLFQSSFEVRSSIQKT